MTSVVVAAHQDWRDMNRWAARDPERDPILSIIGNPPYLRAGLKEARYGKTGWWESVFEKWRKGSGGGGGALTDLYVGFWAWAFHVCRQPHQTLRGGQRDDEEKTQADVPAFGVVSFITNRAWLDGDTYKPMRRWLRQRAARIDVTDFGRGARAGAAGAWSESQPFKIQTGTAVVTVTFDHSDSERVLLYRRASWSDDDGVRVLTEDPPAGYDPDTAEDGWGAPKASRDLLSGVFHSNGVLTGNDPEFVFTDGDAAKIRHAYRALDNRWVTDSPPKKARRGEPVPPGMAPASAEWRRKAIFDDHPAHKSAGGWYAIVQDNPHKPGPAIHATRHLPDHHLFAGRSGRAIPVSGGGGEESLSTTGIGPTGTA